jgi:hypothetical protein
MWDRRHLLSLACVSALHALAMPITLAWAAASTPGEDGVILSVTGAISGAEGSGRIDFDLNALEQLGLTKLKTWTPWTEGDVEFEGVWARRLMQAVGAQGTEVEARALNDYEEVIPIDDFHRYDVLLALRMNGQLMRTRDKGPIWIVYPWSDHPELDDFATREKSVWQLNALHVR